MVFKPKSQVGQKKIILAGRSNGPQEPSPGLSEAMPWGQAQTNGALKGR